jgi:hypothetical protein
MIVQIAYISVHCQIAYHSLLYIGPGVDGGSVSLIIAFLVSFFTFLISVIWYPIKKTIHFFKGLFKKKTPQGPGGNDVAGTDLTVEEKV